MLNSSFKDIQCEVGIVFRYTHRRLDAEDLMIFICGWGLMDANGIRVVMEMKIKFN